MGFWLLVPGVRMGGGASFVFDPLILASSGRQFMVGESGYANEAVPSGGGGSAARIIGG